MGIQWQSCQAAWFQEYKWLDYDQVSDIVTCYICKCNVDKLTADKNIKDAFVSNETRKTLSGRFRYLGFFY